MQIISFKYAFLLIRTLEAIEKLQKKIKGHHYKITHITADSCPELQNMVLN